MKKFGLPIWFPYPNSWLSALILSVLMTAFVNIIRRNSELLLNLARWSNRPEQFLIWLILLLILPIPAIAFLHHFFLSRFISPIPGEKISKIQGFVPGIISWWESLSSWLVFILSTLAATLFCTPFLPFFNLNYEKIITNSSPIDRNIQTIFAVVWLINAALIYQIGYLFKCRLVYGDSVDSLAENSNLDTSPKIVTDSMGDETISTQMQTSEELPAKKPTFLSFITKHGKSPKKIFTIVLIPLVAVWIYLFAKLPEVQQTANLADKIRLSVSSEVTQVSSKSLEVDNFEKGLSKGKSAAKLARVAESQDEWKMVENMWREAIFLMNSVPSSSPDYALSQQKITQYQVYLDFAKQSAGSK
jgi:hypothetical protein